MKDFDLLTWIAFGLAIAGSLFSGFEGLFGTNLVIAILGVFLGRLLLVAFGVGAGYLCYLIYLLKFKKVTI
jgi:hypothetical protein